MINKDTQVNLLLKLWLVSFITAFVGALLLIGCSTVSTQLRDCTKFCKNGKALEFDSDDVTCRCK